MLNGLNPSYEPLAMTLDSNIAMLSSEDVQSKLQNVEQRRANRKSSGEQAAYAASGSSHQSSSASNYHKDQVLQEVEC